MKRSKAIQLTIMLSASPLILAACDDASHTPEVASFKTVQSCIDAGNQKTVCQQALNSAQVASSKAPSFNSQQSCIDQYGPDHCQSRTENGHSVWGPMLAGFVIGQMMNNNQHTPYSRPIYYDRSGGYTSPGLGESHSFTHIAAAQTATVSRGVFGSAAAARGSWGG